MAEKITFNNEIKMIKHCENFEELFKEIKKAFNIDDIYDDKIEIKTEDETDIKNQDDFDELISDEYPPLIVNIPNYSNNQNTNNKNNQNNNPNTNNFDQNNFLKEIGKIIETQVEKVIDQKIKNMSNSNKIIEKLPKLLNENNKNNESKFNDFEKKLENMENNLNSFYNSKMAENSQINENNIKKIEE